MGGTKRRLTMAQAVVTFLTRQYVERDGSETPFFAGCFGIFGHGNTAGLGQALQQTPELRYYQSRNEQAQVHLAIGYAKMKNRLQTFACTSSIGPGATNMVTGAATATINRMPVLLPPGDIFARRNVAPVLQQMESEHSQDISVNDALKPVSRYWDRINRADQITTALPEVMRVLTDPADTGAVTLCLPQDVQTEACDYPAALFERRVWRVPRNRPDLAAAQRAADLIRASQRPLIVAGGGLIYSEATEVLRAFVEQTGIPVAETFAGRGSLRFDHPLSLGGVGATGALAANQVARDADLVIGIGTRYSDFTTSSKTAFQNPNVKFVNINVAAFDAAKHSALSLVGDARATLEELLQLLDGYCVPSEYRARSQALHTEFQTEIDRVYAIRNEPLPSQSELIGALNQHGDQEAVIVCAAGSLPGDLDKLWRARHPKQFHLEYGYSCMGYEIPGALGVKNGRSGARSLGFKSIGALSRSIGSGGFGTRYVYRQDGVLAGDDANRQVETLPVDLAANARSLGAHVIETRSYAEFVAALENATRIDHTTVIYVRSDRLHGVPDYEGWWDVPVAEVSEMPSVRSARALWEVARGRVRYFL